MFLFLNIGPMLKKKLSIRLLYGLKRMTFESPYKNYFLIFIYYNCSNQRLEENVITEFKVGY